MNDSRDGHAPGGTLVGVSPTFAQAMQRAASEQHDAIVAAYAAAPVEVRAILEGLIPPVADTLALALEQLRDARRDPLHFGGGQQLGYCRGLIDAAAQRRELDHGEHMLLSSYSTRLFGGAL